MATYQYGPHEKFLTQITASDTVKLEFCLFDSTAPTTVKTSVAYGDATVTYCKPGESSFTAFPSFGTNNWAELGNGWYQLIIRGATAAELALLDTAGPLKINVAVSGAICPPICRTIVAAAPATVSAILAAAVTFANGATATVAECLRGAWVQGKGDNALSGTTWTWRGPGGSGTAEVTFTVDDANVPTSRTAI